MTKMQIIVIGAGVVLFTLLYFAFDTKPQKQKSLEKSRALAAESTDINALLPTAKAALTPAQSSEILALEQELNNAAADSAKAEALKRLSGKWYEFGQPAIAGGYAEQVAEKLGTEEAWSIAGNTFAICLQTSKEDKVRSFCTQRAIAAYENAISLNPKEVPYRVNLALCYAENPPPNEPMKGPMMLLQLNQQYPDNVLVLNSLARLAIKTGQYDRAKERLERALELDSKNANAICMLAQVYDALGDSNRAGDFDRRCKQINSQ